MKAKQKNILFILIIIALIIALLFVVISTRQTLKEKDQTYTENLKMKSQLDELMAEYNILREQNLQFREELSERDSIILANSAEIEKLIWIQGDYRKIQRRMELLREITQDYASRVDSLLIINEQLQIENEEFRVEIKNQREQNRVLVEEKTKLSEKITEAAVLRAYNIRPHGMRTRFNNAEAETDKANNIERLVIDFTVGENSLVERGEKNIYIRISRPDGVVLSKSQTDEHSFVYQGERLQYSIKRTINYTGKEQKVSVMWEKADKKTPAMKGVYNISIYEGDAVIGTSSITLK